MAWVNNNKRNARFNPNRRDDRLLDAEVTARRPRPKEKPANDSDSEELITKPDFVLSMESDSRVDWLQMALMQAAEGKLKAAALYEVMKHKAFVPSESSHRGKLKAMLTANLHLFSGKQKKALEEAANSWSEGREGGNESRKRRKSSSSSSSESSRQRSKKETGDKGKTGGKEGKEGKEGKKSCSSERTKAKTKGKEKKRKSSSSSESKKSRSGRKGKRS